MGCVLNFTVKDFQQLSKSLPERMAGEYIDKAYRDQIREALHNTTKTQLISILEKPDSTAYKALSKLLMNTMVSKMSDKEKEALPTAFHKILKHTSDTMGLFTKAPSHTGPGSSPVQHHYEILSAAALIENSYKSRSGKSVYINTVDRIDLGIKFSRGYAQPKRFGTIEADILVSRGTINPLSSDFGKTVAIDAKYSKVGKYSNKPAQRQLDGIRTGFRDGKIQEFFFVTNKEFTPDFKKTVNKENLLIAKEFASHSHRIYKGVPKEYLTEQEKRNYPTEKISDSFFADFNKDVTDFINKYNIPQIEMCEFVKYPGT